MSEAHSNRHTRRRERRLFPAHAALERWVFADPYGTRVTRDASVTDLFDGRRLARAASDEAERMGRKPRLTLDSERELAAIEAELLRRGYTRDRILSVALMLGGITGLNRYVRLPTGGTLADLIAAHVAGDPAAASVALDLAEERGLDAGMWPAVEREWLVVHHRRFGCGQITCGDADPRSLDTPRVERVTCEPCRAELRARRLLPRRNESMFGEHEGL